MFSVHKCKIIRVCGVWCCVWEWVSEWVSVCVCVRVFEWASVWVRGASVCVFVCARACVWVRECLWGESGVCVLWCVVSLCVCWLFLQCLTVSCCSVRYSAHTDTSMCAPFLPEQPRNPHRKMFTETPSLSSSSSSSLSSFHALRCSLRAPQTKDFHALQRHILTELHTVTDANRATVTDNPPGEHRDELTTVILLVIQREARGKTLLNATLARNRGRDVTGRLVDVTCGAGACWKENTFLRTSDIYRFQIRLIISIRVTFTETLLDFN